MSATRVAEDEKQQPKARPTKARARRVPAGVVLGVTPPPDPERWLKKSERSTYMQGRGKRKGGATQGLVESGGGVHAPSTNKGGGGGKGKKKKK
jgi:signal recognition particle subunit SRP72